MFKNCIQCGASYNVEDLNLERRAQSWFCSIACSGRHRLESSGPSRAQWKAYFQTDDYRRFVAQCRRPKRIYSQPA